jgi:hypothetical protein
MNEQSRDWKEFRYSWDLKKVIIPERLETLSLLLKENRREDTSGTGKAQAYFKEEHQWKALPHMTTT